MSNNPTLDTKDDKEALDEFTELLNNRAEELGLDKNVKPIIPEQISSVTWVFEKDDGELVDLGWSVETAYERLSQLKAG